MRIDSSCVVSMYINTISMDFFFNIIQYIDWLHGFEILKLFAIIYENFNSFSISTLKFYAIILNLPKFRNNNSKFQDEIHYVSHTFDTYIKYKRIRILTDIEQEAKKEASGI